MARGAGARARALADALAEDGVDGVALSYVDNAGVTRVKAVPVDGLPHAAGWGVGMSPVFDVFCVDDSITSGRLAGGPGWRPAAVPGPRPARRPGGAAGLGVGAGGPVHPGRRRAPRVPAQLRATGGGGGGRRRTRRPDGLRGRVGGGDRRGRGVPSGVQRSGVRDDPDGRAVGLLPRPADRARRRVGGGAAAAPGVRRGAVRALGRAARPGGAPRTRCCSCGRRCGRCPAGTAWTRRSRPAVVAGLGRQRPAPAPVAASRRGQPARRRLRPVRDDRRG